MGLPMWNSQQYDAKDAAKVDLQAPARSPIRRRSPAVAGRRAGPNRAPRSPPLADTDAAFRVYTNRARGSRVRLPPPPVPESRNYARLDAATRNSTSTNDERAFSAEQEARDILLSQFDEITRSYTSNFAPAAAATRNGVWISSSGRRRSAQSFPTGDPPRLLRGEQSDYVPREGSQLWDDGDDNSDNNAVSLPPLRRMGRRTIADGPLPSSSLRESWSPATDLDGLGDRERSMSPGEDQTHSWDTFLSTVAPDPLPPTADSSFTSAAASASFSNSHPSSRAGSANSNSASSSRTHLTVPSRRPSLPSNETFMRACDTSDSDSASDTEEEDVDFRGNFSSLREGQQHTRPSRNGPNRERGFTLNRSLLGRGFRGSDYRLPPRNQVDGPVPAEDSSFDFTPRSRDQVDGPAPAEEPSLTNVEDELQSLDQELRDARAILERLTRREDLPDGFWASVGLTRPMADRVERIQQRERM